MKPNAYGLDGKHLSCRDFVSAPVTGLSSPEAAQSDQNPIDTTIGSLTISAFFIALVCFLVSQSNMLN